MRADVCLGDRLLGEVLASLLAPVSQASSVKPDAHGWGRAVVSDKQDTVARPVASRCYFFRAHVAQRLGVKRSYFACKKLPVFYDYSQRTHGIEKTMHSHRILKLK